VVYVALRGEQRLKVSENTVLKSDRCRVKVTQRGTVIRYVGFEVLTPAAACLQGATRRHMPDDTPHAQSSPN
jgi:hypothetical protein